MQVGFEVAIRLRSCRFSVYWEDCRAVLFPCITYFNSPLGSSCGSAQLI